MPRKPLTYTHELPYHVFARANNKEWFYLPKQRVWKIFISQLNHVVNKYGCLVHSFVLMDNHYHMLVTTHPNHNLGIVMQSLQRSVSRIINKKAGRSNHIFGGPYRASLIKSPEDYFKVYKYVYRNPIEAGICSSVEEYPYSTHIQNDVAPLTSPITGIANLIPTAKVQEWINEADDIEIVESVKLGLRKTVFKPQIPRKY